MPSLSTTRYSRRGAVKAALLVLMTAALTGCNPFERPPEARNVSASVYSPTVGGDVYSTLNKPSGAAKGLFR